MAHQKYRIRKALAAVACTISAAIVVVAVVTAYRDTHAAPITVAPAVALSSAVQAQAKRTPVIPKTEPVPRTVEGPSVRNGEYTYYTTYLYNPSRVCTALISKWQDPATLNCVLVQQ